ncbi:KH domain-containing protein [Candidatus Woesearchaeota archaeon]|nr:KH domain-containing protein [Candidatus Woesearchaeota archaeon]
MYQYEIKIPKDRIAVLIGVKGKIKKEIEQTTKSKLKIDSEEGDIFIQGEDSLGLITAKDIIQAVGRGINPEVALLLLKADYCMEIIDISDYSRKSKKDMLRLKGRVIGKEGKSRRTIESLTETNICVYGKTITIIGELARVSLAKRAVENLLQGSPHTKVYSWLEKKRKELSRGEFLATQKR